MFGSVPLLPRSVHEWRQIALGVWNSIGEDNIVVVSAGVAFFATLAVFPAVASVLTLYGLVADPQVARAQLQHFAAFMPPEARSLLFSQVHAFISASRGVLSFGFVASLLFAVISANSGMKALITAINIAYDQPERRSIIRFNLLSLGVTLGAIGLATLTLALIAALPAVLHFLHIARSAQALWLYSRWPALTILILLSLGAVYQYGPAHRSVASRWISWGALVATPLWLLGCLLFSLYVESFADYNRTYGTLGAAIALQMWFFVTAFVVLLGAEVNAEIERRLAHAHKDPGHQAMHATPAKHPGSGEANRR